jgi:hypothetical protein
MYKMTAAFPRTVATLALLAQLTAGAKVCGRVPDCVIDVGRACARKHLPQRHERAAAAKVVAARNSQDVDSDGCYTEKWMIQHINDPLSVEEIPMMKELGELPAAVAHQVISYLECVETSEAAEDMSRHGQACDDVCANMCPREPWSANYEAYECRDLCSLKLGCLAENEAYYYDPSADNAEVECVDLSVEACEAAILAATHEDGAEPVMVGPLRNAAIGEACRVAFARDELSEDDDAVTRLLYAGEARETAKTLMKHQNSKIGRRFKRLREELSSRTAGRDL